jgi:hypothetical protein
VKPEVADSEAEAVNAREEWKPKKNGRSHGGRRVRVPSTIFEVWIVCVFRGAGLGLGFDRLSYWEDQGASCLPARKEISLSKYVFSLANPMS